MPKMNTYPLAVPADDNSLIGIDVSDTTQSPQGSTVLFSFLAIWGYVADKIATLPPDETEITIDPSADNILTDGPSGLNATPMWQKTDW